MALETQLVSLSLRGGLDAKSDRKSVVPGQLLEAENCVFTSPGQLSKRKGYEALPAPQQSGARPQTKGLLTRDEELLLADGSQLWAYSSEEARWLSRGSYVPMRVTQRRVVSDEYQQTHPDGARHEETGLELFAWEDSRGGIWWTLLDGAQVLRPPAQLTADGSKCRVLAVGNVFAVVYQRAGIVCMRTLSVASPAGQLQPEQHLSAAEGGGDYSLHPAHQLWDAESDGESLLLGYRSSTGVAVRVWTGTALLELKQDAVPGFLSDNEVPPALTVVARPDNGPVLAYVADDNLHVWGWNAELSSRGSVLMGRPAPGFPLHITGGSELGFSAGIGAWLFLSDGMEWWLPGEGNAYVRLPIYDCQPAARPFIREGAVYVPTLHHRSDLQSTYFLWRIGATGPLAKWHAGVAGTARSHQAPLPSVMQGAKSISLVCGVKDRSETEAGGWVFGTESVSSVSLDFGADISSAELGGALQLSGGCLQMYDGQRVVESGFHLYPEIIRTHRTGGGGKLSEGTYSWVAVYSWTDATGRIHRSAPSLPVRGEFEDGDSGTVTVQPLAITAKTAVTVELYRTLADGSMLYRTGPGMVVKPGEQLSGVMFDEEGPTDEELQGNLPLYTQPLQLDAPQVLENHAPPPVGALAVHRSRLWVVDSTQPDQLWFSREVGPGAPPEFSDVAYMHVPAGAVTALGSLDSALVLFGASRIHGLVGQGPDATGQFSDFAEPQHISSDVGCTSARSIATVAQGLVFQSSKGLYLLSRDFQVQAMAGIEGYLKPDVHVQAAHLMQHSHQVRFVLSSGKVLVWDYLVGQWSVFTGLDAADAVVLAGEHVVARTSGQVWRETASQHTDNGAPIRMRIATSWLQFGDMGGFQRIRRAMLVGEFASPHQLRLSVGYNFEPNPSEHQTLTPVPSPGYGEVYAFDEGQPYGGRYPLYAWRAHLKRQKCTAVQFIIEDLPTADFGEGLHLSAIALEVGLKRGSHRRRASATFRSPS